MTPISLQIPACVQLENVGCPMGCAADDVVVLRGRDRLHELPGEFTVVRCRTCGLLRTNPRPTADTIGFYYPDDYGPYLGTRVQGNAPGPVRFLKDRVRSLLRFNTANIPPLEPGRLLEIGCASGSFLHHMAMQGWEVAGIEPSAVAARNAGALGYPVHTGLLSDAPEPDRPFDLIVGWMVVEHLNDPVAGLERLWNWIKPGGWLAISVPDTGAWEFSCFGSRWYALHLPAHLFHFSQATLEKVLARSGWATRQVFHQRTFINIAPSLGYLMEDVFGKNRLSGWLRELPDASAWVNVLCYPFAWVLAGIGQTGRITVWAQKI